MTQVSDPNLNILLRNINFPAFPTHNLIRSLAFTNQNMTKNKNVQNLHLLQQ